MTKRYGVLVHSTIHDPAKWDGWYLERKAAEKVARYFAQIYPMMDVHIVSSGGSLTSNPCAADSRAIIREFSTPLRVVR